MAQCITRRLLTKKFLLTATAFAFFGIYNRGSNPDISPKVRPLDDHFVSINGWVVAKNDLVTTGRNKNAG